MLDKDVKEFEKYCQTHSSATTEEEYADKEELTVMDGFRYRVDSSPYPVYRGKQRLVDFPVIPIGMLDVWRSETQGDDFF